MKGRKILITGGMGFIGSNLAHRLVQEGARVRILDNFHPDYGANPFNLQGIEKEVEIIQGDVRDEASVEKAVRDVEIVFHLAAQVSHVDSMSQPFYDLDVNARGTLILLEACRKTGSPIRFIYGGTRGQYGRLTRTPVDETHPLFPRDIYGVHKTAGELYTLVYTSAFGLQGVSLRISNTYGPRHQMKHPKYGVLNYFIRLALDNQTIPIFGDGSQLRDYIYVEDVVEALLLAARSSEATGEVWNLGSGHPIPFREMVEKIVKICGSGRYEFVPFPEERKRIETGDFVADTSRISSILGWSPRVGLENGLRETIDFYRRYRQYYW